MRVITLGIWTVAVFVGCKNEGASNALPPQTPTSAAAVTSISHPPAASPTPSTAAPATPRSASTITRDFENDAIDAPPTGFSFGRTGQGKPGRWVVHTDGAAKVLAQVDADDTDYRFAVAVLNEPVLRDVRVRVRCKQVSGKVDQACGVVFRYQDENNFFITRANALENNVRLYFVKDGSRKQIASWSGTVKSGAWHDYQVEARGDHIEVTWDGAKILDQHDGTFAGPGRAGLWTKADSVTYFDDFKVEAL